MPERIKALEIDIGVRPAGLLARDSQFVFTYKPDQSGAYRGPWLSLLMNPDQAAIYQSNGMFPVLDMNLPEGYLYEQIRARFPKQNITEMHLLLAVGTNSIGRNSARLPGAPARMGGPTIDRATLLNSTNSQALFPELVDAYLASGAGVSGVQPKIMLPDRASIPVPTLIVKSGPDYYPGLSANEFIALSAAKRAGIEVSGFDLSADGGLLVLDRFDIGADGSRLGFEDIPSLLGLHHREPDGSRRCGSRAVLRGPLRLRSAEQPCGAAVGTRGGCDHAARTGERVRGVRQWRRAGGAAPCIARCRTQWRGPLRCRRACASARDFAPQRLHHGQRVA